MGPTGSDEQLAVGTQRQRIGPDAGQFDQRPGRRDELIDRRLQPSAWRPTVSVVAPKVSAGLAAPAWQANSGKSQSQGSGKVMFILNFVARRLLLPKRLTISDAKMRSKDVRGALRFPSWPKPGPAIYERGSQISACLQVAGHNEKCSACCAGVTFYRLTDFCSQRGEARGVRRPA